MQQEKVEEEIFEENIEMVEISKNFVYSKAEKILFHDDVPVTLNVKQTILIDMLSSNINNTVDYDALTLSIWENDYIADSALRTLVYSIRKLLPELPILSHSKVGYSLNKS
ncbi:MAG TPA: helix-turn-helix domain-containing protein [Sulfurovum sp.]|nr:helix-turn-helix domain-containing protein [Sulfurovum sp.]